MASLLYRRCARAVAQRPFASTSQCTLDMHGCRHQTVRAASSASDNGNGQKKPPSTPSIRKTRKDPFADPDFTLEHFLLRDKCVKLWRDFLRASRNIPNPEARRETIDWLRDEHFEGPSGLRNVSSVTRIREGLLAGSVTLKRVCGPMELAAALLPQHGSFPKIRGRRRAS